MFQKPNACNEATAGNAIFEETLVWMRKVNSAPKKNRRKDVMRNQAMQRHVLLDSWGMVPFDIETELRMRCMHKTQDKGKGARKGGKRVTKKSSRSSRTWARFYVRRGVIPVVVIL